LRTCSFVQLKYSSARFNQSFFFFSFLKGFLFIHRVSSNSFIRFPIIDGDTDQLRSFLMLLFVIFWFFLALNNICLSINIWCFSWSQEAWRWISENEDKNYLNNLIFVTDLRHPNLLLPFENASCSTKLFGATWCVQKCFFA